MMAAVTVVLDTNTRFDKNFAHRERERVLEIENFILKAL